MPRWKPKRVVLTVPQRRALLDHIAFALEPYERPLTSGKGPWSVLPSLPARLTAKSSTTAPRKTATVPKSLRGLALLPAELRGPYGRLPAVAVPAMQDKAALSVVRTADVDAVWQVGDSTRVLMTDGELPENGEQRNELSLIDLLEGHGVSWQAAVRGWTSGSSPGWVQGGPLGASCDVCTAPLIWFDWRRAGADIRRSSWLAGCPEHGPVHWPRSSIPPLVQSRRQLDSALWVRPWSTGTFSCYVFELHGLEPGAVYVGETSHPVARRLEQHASGEKAAKELRREGVAMGLQRPDLLPHLPPLPTRNASRAAEQWVAAVLTRRGTIVYGGH